MMRLYVAGLSLCMVAVVWAATPQYMVVIPKELRNGMNFKVDVRLLEAQSNNVGIIVAIHKLSDTASDLVWDEAQFTITIVSGDQTGTGSVMVPFDVMTGEQYYVLVTFEGMSVEPEFVPVPVTRPISAIFVQTDKGIYKPTDVVYFRALVADEELKIQNEILTVTIKDSRDSNVMQLKSDPSNGNGQLRELLVSDSFPISDDPVMGEYQIICETATNYIKRTFIVEEYVLPKFEVILTLDKDFFIDDDSPTVSGTVEAKFSYGSGVKGTMVLKINNEVVQTIPDFDGSKDFTDIKVKIEDSPWMRGDWYRPSTTIKISAEVTQLNTKNTMNDSKIVQAYPVGFAATLLPLPNLFQGQTEYTFEVKLTDPMGGQLTVAPSDLSRYQLYYKARTDTAFKNESVQDLEPQPVTLTMLTSDDNLYDNEFEVFYSYTPVEGDKQESPHVRGKFSKYYTYSLTTIDLEVISTNQNETCFKLTPFESSDVAYYQVVNNYQPESILPYTSTNGHCFNINRNHAPRSKVVAYKYVSYTDGKTDGTELLTATVDIDLTWTPEQSVTLTVTPSEVKPGNPVDIAIQTTTGPSIVGLSALDKSSTFLKAANDIKFKDLLDAVKAYRLFDRTRENPTPNPPMFPRPMPMFFEKDLADKKRKKRCSACISSDQYMDPRKELEGAGLLVITDASVKRQDSFSTNDGGGNDWGVRVMMAEAIPQAVDGVADSGAEVDYDEAEMDEDDGIEAEETTADVRQYFPETWLWDVVITDSNGGKTVRKDAPDSITNWVFNAFAFSSQSGLGVAETQELTVKQPFFISMNLPYSVVQGESFMLQILVLNYEDSSLQVDVVLSSSPNYTIGDDSGLKTKEILPSNSNLFQVNITMTKIGQIPLLATATNVGNSLVDIVRRELLVKPAGREIRVDTQTQIVMPQNGEFKLNTSNFFNTYKDEDFVEGSLRMYLQFTGDMMAPFIDSIGKKIQMPYGCGEQNIKSLTPSVFVARYLKAINRFESAIEGKVRVVCGAGYRKELIYMHPDGSFSAFGFRSNLCECGMAGRMWGSTWLTAYVLKTFSLVYLDGLAYVDFGILKKSFEYITNNASHPDCDSQYYVEEGQLIHTEMQGDTTSRFGFTAFVLISILDYKDAAMKAGDDESYQKAEKAIENATLWLHNKEDAILESKTPYQMAICAYALARGSNTADLTSIKLMEKYEEMKSAESDSNNSMLDTPEETLDIGECIYKPGSESVRKSCNTDYNCGSGQVCCDVTCGDGKKLCMQKPGRYYRSTSDSSQVEMRGYALMAYLELYKKEGYANKKALYKTKADDLKDWLLARRKGNGFFHSTQDTVVAFEALARYALTFNNSVGAEFTIKAKSNEMDVSELGTVTADTYIVNHELKLDVTSPTNDVSVVVVGSAGTAYISLVALYNVDKDVPVKPFNITITSGITIGGEPVIRQCFIRDPLFKQDTGPMVVTTIALQSGFNVLNVKSPMIEKLAASKSETVENTLTLYYMKQDDNFSEKRCVDIQYDETFIVSNRKPGKITVMDYYQQENNVEVLYDISRSEECLDCPTTGASSAGLNTLLVIAAGTVALIARFLQLE